MTRNNLDPIEQSDEQQPREKTLQEALLEIEQSMPGPKKVSAIVKYSTVVTFDIFSKTSLGGAGAFLMVSSVVNRRNTTQFGDDLQSGYIGDAFWGSKCTWLILSVLGSGLNQSGALTKLIKDGVRDRFYHCGGCEGDLDNRFTDFLIILGVVEKRKDDTQLDPATGGLKFKCTFVSNQHWNGYTIFQNVLAEFNQREVEDRSIQEDNWLKKLAKKGIRFCKDHWLLISIVILLPLVLYKMFPNISIFRWSRDFVITWSSDGFPFAFDKYILKNQ